MHFKYNPITAVVALALVFLTHSLQRQLVLAGDNDSLEETREPRYTFDLGPISVDTYYNETKYNDKLKLSKSYVKYVIKSKMTNQKYVVKWSQAEQLIRCENLTLANAEMEQLLDCKRLEEQVLAAGNKQTQPSTSGSKTDYVKRLTIKFGKRPWNSAIKAYPLQQEFVDRSLDTILANLNVKTLNFGSYATSSGHYLEWTFGSGLRCAGNYFTFINQSMPTPGPPADEYPQMVDFFEFQVLQIVDNGGLVSIQDFTCERPDQLIPISLDIDFTLIRRMEFPYLTCRHTMVTQPMSALWKYEGLIDQKRDARVSNDAYNTTIKIRSISDLFEIFNFELDQTFVNSNLKSGYEKMTLNHPFFGAVVNGNWTVDSLMKSLDLYLITPEGEAFKKNTAHLGVIVMPDVKVSFEDKPDDDFLTLSFKMTRIFKDNLIEALHSAVGGEVRKLLPDDQNDIHRHLEL